MKKLIIISIFTAAAAGFISCSDVKRSPGRTYIPDMAYSRAYETYSVTEEQRQELLKQGIHFSNTPVPGTVKRGADYTFRLPKDSSARDSTNYVASKGIRNPISMLDSSAMKESERLYLINCGICHGAALDGNGPLHRGGEGPYAAKPRALVSDPITDNMPDGQMFYSVTYGKGAMGSYASQLNPTQRWMVIHYIKRKQAEKKATGSVGTQAASDTAATNPPGVTTSGETRPGSVIQKNN
ncbi:MAG TPA: cytochrome c [Chitinophagaceae bacterium]|nr:cytochrome c [Chitinophagaceae bacterium]